MSPETTVCLNSILRKAFRKLQISLQVVRSTGGLRTVPTARVPRFYDDDRQRSQFGGRIRSVETVISLYIRPIRSRDVGSCSTSCSECYYLGASNHALRTLELFRMLSVPFVTLIQPISHVCVNLICRLSPITRNELDLGSAIVE